MFQNDWSTSSLQMFAKLSENKALILNVRLLHYFVNVHRCAQVVGVGTWSGKKCIFLKLPKYTLYYS